MGRAKKTTPERIVSVLRQIAVEVEIVNGKTHPAAGREAGIAFGLAVKELHADRAFKALRFSPQKPHPVFGGASDMNSMACMELLK